MKYSFSEQIIRSAFLLSVWCIEQVHRMAPYHQKVTSLSSMPAGTVGKELATCLLARNLTLVPGFESHDLKHMLLDYELEPLGEIRLQAFMLGNGNWTLPSLSIFLFGLLLLPQHWRQYWRDFKAGRQIPAIASLTVEDCEDQQLLEFRRLIFSRYTENTLTLKPDFHQQASFWGSYALITVGAAAMLFCFPFLWSANVADLVGAGFPFVAGSIFVAGGFLNLTLRGIVGRKEVRV